MTLLDEPTLYLFTCQVIEITIDASFVKCVTTVVARTVPKLPLLI